MREAPSLLAEALVDLLAIRAHWGTGLCLLGDGERLATQRDHHFALDGRFDDLVLLHIVKELWGSVLRLVLGDLFGALDCRSARVTHNDPSCPARSAFSTRVLP